MTTISDLSDADASLITALVAAVRSSLLPGASAEAQASCTQAVAACVHRWPECCAPLPTGLQTGGLSQSEAEGATYWMTYAFTELVRSLPQPQRPALMSELHDRGFLV